VRDKSERPAAGTPTISSDGLTYTFKLRSNVRFGPPLTRAITSKDVEYAFERINTAPLVAQYGSYYCGVIKGMDCQAKSPAPVSGIETPDDATIVFHLEQPTGDFLYRLAMPATAPVPRAAHHGPQPQLRPEQRRPAQQLRRRGPDQRRHQHQRHLQPGRVGHARRLLREPAKTILARYLTDANRKQLLHADSSDQTWYITMNLDQPPFDDIHHSPTWSRSYRAAWPSSGSR